MTVHLYPHEIKDSEAKRNTEKYGPLNEMREQHNLIILSKDFEYIYRYFFT